MQWNIRGYINNYAILQILIKKYSPKVYVNLNIPINYNIYNLNTSTTRYGGVAILAHKSLEWKQTFSSNDFDVVGIEIYSRRGLVSSVSAY